MQTSESSIIGFNIGDQVVGLSALGRLVMEPFRRPTSATAHFVAAGALAARGVQIVVADLFKPATTASTERSSKLEDTRSLLEMPVTARLSRPKRPRWTQAERNHLIGLLAQRPVHRPGYAKIAAEMTARFGRPFTVAAIGAQTRKLRRLYKPSGQLRPMDSASEHATSSAVRSSS